MKWLIISLVSITLCCQAGEKRGFFGTWEPPRSLLDFWKPLNDSDMKIPAKNRRMYQRCKQFAQRTRPETVIPDIINDLRANPSEARWFVYCAIVVNWPRQRTLKILAPYRKSRDPQVRQIADEFYADVEDTEKVQ